MKTLTELDIRTDEETEVLPPIPCTASDSAGRCDREAKWDALVTCDLLPSPRTRHWCDDHKEEFMDESLRLACNCQGYRDFHHWNLLLLLAR